eukprot:gene5388-7471_t
MEEIKQTSFNFCSHLPEFVVNELITWIGIVELSLLDRSFCIHKNNFRVNVWNQISTSLILSPIACISLKGIHNNLLMSYWSWIISRNICLKFIRFNSFVELDYFVTLFQSTLMNDDYQDIFCQKLTTIEFFRNSLNKKNIKFIIFVFKKLINCNKLVINYSELSVDSMDVLLISLSESIKKLTTLLINCNKLGHFALSSIISANHSTLVELSIINFIGSKIADTPMSLFNLEQLNLELLSYLTDDGLRSFSLGLTKLNRLRLSNMSSISNNGMIMILPHLMSLSELVLDLCYFSCEGLFGLLSKKIIRIILSDCPTITDKGLYDLLACPLPNLQDLHIFNNLSISGRGLLPVLPPSLLTLDIINLPALVNEGLLQFQIHNLTNLTYLGLNNLPSLQLDQLVLQLPVSLQFLSIIGLSINNNNGLRQLFPKDNDLTNLKFLQLSILAGITDDASFSLDINSIFISKLLKNLEISSSFISDKILYNLFNVNAMSCLLSLSIAHTPYVRGDNGSYLPALPHTLTSLHLSNLSNLSDIGLKQLLSSNVSNLTYLNISSCDKIIGESMTGVLPQSLKSLYLNSNNSVSFRGLHDLLSNSLSNLNHLNIIQGNYFNDHNLKDMVTALVPNCTSLFISLK